jgi:hypothetical protein
MPDLRANTPDRGDHSDAQWCRRCKGTGIVSCLPFPCGHGGHVCDSCNGTGMHTGVVVSW